MLQTQIDERAENEIEASRTRHLALLVSAANRVADIEEAGFDVAAADEPGDAGGLIARLSPDVVVVGTGETDSSMARALAFVRDVREQDPVASIPIVVLTNGRTAAAIELAYTAGATDVWHDGAGEVVWKKRLPFVVSAARAFDELSRSSQKLERAKRLARFATWEWDLSTQQVSWSEELRYLLARGVPARARGIEAVLAMVDESDRSRVEETIAESIKERRPFRFDHRAVRPDGTELVLHQEGDVVVGGSEDEVSVEAVVIDVTEIKKAELQIHSLANYDSLTGLLNRLSFLNLLKNARARSERSGGPIAVALLDMDRFKEVNESLGHGAGDQLLKEVAGRLLSSVRKGDCVAREVDGYVRTVARHGGDEFLVLLSDVDEAHHAALAARRLLDALRRPFRIEGREVFATASIGHRLRGSGGGGNRRAPPAGGDRDVQREGTGAQWHPVLRRVHEPGGGRAIRRREPASRGGGPQRTAPRLSASGAGAEPGDRRGRSLGSLAASGEGTAGRRRVRSPGRRDRAHRRHRPLGPENRVPAAPELAAGGHLPAAALGQSLTARAAGAGIRRQSRPDPRGDRDRSGRSSSWSSPSAGWWETTAGRSKSCCV